MESEKVFRLPASFVGDFKVGDNINYNLDVLSELYRAQAEDNAYRELFIKPIIINIMSIIEAVLYDFHHRIKGFTREGVSNVSESILSRIRIKKIDDLEKYIVSAKKNNFFDTVREDFYNDLDMLRKVRNRIHIQNDKNYPPKDESEVFTKDNQYLAECALEVVLRTMIKKYPRPHTKSKYVRDFAIPWEARYEENFKG